MPTPSSNVIVVLGTGVKKTEFLRHGENLTLQQNFFVVLSDAFNPAF